MVIKILSASGTFQGIEYNEKKLKEGVANLMVQKNFEAVPPELRTINHLKKYMELVSASNKKTKNKQFHAVVSGEGRKQSFEELKMAAVSYLEHMGYGDNPYLIYGHNDTENNHVHIVSTRIDKQGIKINDSFENVRTQKFIEKELNIEFSKDFNKEKFLKYNFSTLAQFKLLLELQNFKAVTKKDSLIIYSAQKKVGEIPMSHLNEIIKNRKSNSKDINKIKALFYKYKAEFQTDQFVKEMRKNFGYEIVLHYGKPKDTKIPESSIKNKKPYGYTVIDHNGNNVYKGSEVMPLSFVLNNIQEKEHVALFHKTSDELLKNKQSSLFKFNGALKEFGYKVSYKGEVFSTALNKDFTNIDADYLKKLLYYNKVFAINDYYSSDPLAASVLRNYYKIDGEDFNIKTEMDLNKENYINGLMEQLFIKGAFNKEKLEDKNLKIIKNLGAFFIVSLEDKIIAPIPEAYYNVIEPEHKLIAGQNLQKSIDTSENINSTYTLLNDLLGGGDDDEDFRKKNKKKRKPGQNRSR